jgi:hypothetical protein
MLTVKLNLYKLNKILISVSRSTVLAAIALMCGSIPEPSPQFASFSLIARAYAQNFTPEETLNYAKAGYRVELLRQQIYKEIKNIIDRPPPNIVCNQQETLQSLPNNVRQIAERYCNESRQIVREHNLSIDRFNELKQYYDRGDDFYQQVQKILIDLQR